MHTPTSDSVNSIHKQDGIGKDSAESAGKGSGNEQVRDALCLLLSLVDHGQVQVQAWEKTRLANTEE